MKQILLGSEKNKVSKNEDNFIDIELSADMQSIPYTEDAYTVDAYEQYYKEKNASNKYRLAFTISPVCSNILFNIVSEPVYKEGSSACTVFTTFRPTPTGGGSAEFKNFADAYESSIGRTSKDYSTRGLIKDTIYSHAELADNYTPVDYHPGYDIFNNHYLRKKEQSIISKITSKTENNYKSFFNQIDDYARKSDGTVVRDNPLIYYSNTRQVNTNYNVAMHTYSFDTIDSYEEAVSNNLIEYNGWIGFRNKSTLKIDNYLRQDNKYISVYRCLNDKNPNEFIDMYPDRTLYSFVPKFNKYRGREERNWDYCLTYPASSNSGNTLVMSTGGINGLECKIKTKIDTVPVSEAPSVVLFKSYVRHGLSVGDYITLSFFVGSKPEQKTQPCRILSVGNDGDDAQHYFTISMEDIFSILISNTEGETPVEDVISVDPTASVPTVKGYSAVFSVLGNTKIRFRKYENGQECQYYLRKFKKLPAQPSSALNKLAFSQNPYSDQNVQIVFTDDIRTVDENGELLLDNLGRPLTEVYLTIIKRNKGRNKWYRNTNPIYGADDIEYSHCFGAITSGFDLPEEENAKEYNVHRMHNISNPPSYIPSGVSRLEFDITVDNNEFYGDLVEFTPSLMREITLEDVYHRFNTAQREIKNLDYRDFYYDEIALDDVDRQTDTSASAFKIVTSSATETFLGQTSESTKYINLMPEGYYYKPHYKIQLREYRDTVSEGYHIKVLFDNARKTGVRWEIDTKENYFFQERKEDVPGSTVYAYKLNSNKQYELAATGECVGVSGNGFKHVTIVFNHGGIDITQDCILFKHNTEMPDYAYDLKDGSGKYIWREILPYEEIPVGDELYDSQFTNGAHYFHKNINFYLKRQDPDGRYGLGAINEIRFFQIADNTKDVSYAEYKTEHSNSSTC